MISDLAARQTSLDPQRSFIVQAPAGSGKTGLLVYRLLTLLATVDQPQQILAITFTRKATAEMRERLLHLMQQAQDGQSSDDTFEQQGIELAQKVLERDREKNWNLLKTSHQLQLLTIDSFCGRLTASMPWLSRLGDRSRTTDKADSHYASAVEALLGELLNDDSPIANELQTVLLELDFNYNKARDLFSSMLAKRDQWLRHLLRNNLPSLRAEFEKAWQEIVDEHIEQLSKGLSEATTTQLIDSAIYAANNIVVKEGEESFLLPFHDYAPDNKLNFQQWQAICQLALTKSGSFRSRLTKGEGFPAGNHPEKENLKALLSSFEGDEHLKVIMCDVLQLPQPHFSDDDWQQLLALEKVLKALAAFLQLRFRSKGECDHTEITQRANLALQELDNPTDLGLRMDYHIHHVLVDEFQDTSNGQIELLKKLTSGWLPQETGPAKTLFLVGDPMQSIYRFREADVSLFLQVVNNKKTKIFENLNIESLSLTENFRSSADLVNWFNEMFSKSFPSQDNVLTGAIRYANACSQKTAQKGEVVYQLAHSKQQEAKLLVEQVQQAIVEQKPDQKIAILVRGRSQLKEVIPALQQAGIAYTGVDIQNLNEQQAVIDILALCKAICREDDRISWMALLRGPWCGLSLDELKKVTLKQNLTLWQQLNDAPLIAQMSQETQLRITRFRSIMSEVLAQRQQVDLGNLTRWAWQSLGGQQTLFGLSFDDVDTVFKLIQDLQRGGDLPSINDLDKALDGLYAVSSGADSNAPNVEPKVVISTMHKSKGLQYDTVILPGLGTHSPADKKEIMMWAEHQNKQGTINLLIAPYKFDKSKSVHYEYLRSLESKRSNNEKIRLMYVAATRAERKLVLLAKADISKKTNEVNKPASNTLLATMWSVLESKFDFACDPEEDELSLGLSQTLYRLSSDYQTDYPASIEWQVEQQLNAQEESSIAENDNADDHATTEFEWATNAASAVGTILHGWLQYNCADISSAQISQAQVNAWRTELLALRVPEIRLEYAIRNLKQAVENIKVDEQAAFIFKNYEIEQNEYALSAFEDGMVKKSIIDRTFVDENNVRWIVDYKSTPTRDKDLRAFAQEQVKDRHQSQLERYGALMSQIDTREIKLAVYFPLIKQLVSWSYQAKNN